MTTKSARPLADGRGARDDSLHSTAADGRLLVSRREACRLLDLGESTLARLTRDGAIRSRRIGRRRVYAVDDLRAWIDAGCPARPSEEGGER